MKLFIFLLLIQFPLSFYVISQPSLEFIKNSIKQGPINDHLPDFAFAGFFYRDQKTSSSESFPVFNVKDYGAIPDDNLDDHVAIQAAINAAQQQNGGVVYIPSGNYFIKGGDYDNILRITSSNITITGEFIDNEIRTKLTLRSHSKSKNIGLLGQDRRDLRSIATISIEGNAVGRKLATFQGIDHPRGTRIVAINDTSQLSPNQTVMIKIAENSTQSTHNQLLSALTSPYQFTGSESSSLIKYASLVSYITKIRRIIDHEYIELYQPLRFDHLDIYEPTIYELGALSAITIQNIEFSSEWHGDYVHHKPYPLNSSGTDVIRSSLEQDYGWVGVWGISLLESKFSNLKFHNYTQNIVLSNSAFTDISDITIEGDGGHAGITLSSTHNLLIENVHFDGDFVHPLSLRAWSSGNVFRKISTSRQHFDSYSKTGPFIDFHGLYPYENLFEMLDGFYVHSGGDKEVMPHSGVRNVFWNIKAPSTLQRFEYALGEFFNTSQTQAKYMHHYHPKSVVFGVFNDNTDNIYIGKNLHDRDNDMIKVFQLNHYQPSEASLYIQQRAEQQERYPVSPNPPSNLKVHQIK